MATYAALGAASPRDRLPKDPPKRDKDSLRVVGFDKGKGGFRLKLGTGKKTPAEEQLKVIHITEEGQAYWKGVKPGWVIKRVNGQGIEKDSRTLTFSATITKMLKEAAGSGKKYKITFVLPDEDARHRARRSMSIPTGTRLKKMLQPDEDEQKEEAPQEQERFEMAQVVNDERNNEDEAVTDGQ